MHYSPGVDPIAADHIANEALSCIEIAEARQLNWGFINGAQTAEDIARLLAESPPHLDEDAPTLSPEAIIENLVARRLLLRQGSGSTARYRSRFAETIRTLFLLRQRFSDDDWRTGDRLVGDLKLLPQRRRFPRRDQPAARLLDRLAARGTPADLQEALAALLGVDSDTPFMLAQFQVDAVEQILAGLAQTQDQAVVVGAGTGSGKTLAFYLPALAHLAHAVAATPALHTLALYPRKELLKDQLNEIYREARKLERFLRAHGKRPLCIGAYFGDVPATAADLTADGRSPWPHSRDGAGYECPYLRCPTCNEQSMIWRNADVEAEIADNRRGIYGRHARLICRHCNTPIEQETLALTRRQMVHRPPDILFTTTEMLNRRLGHQGEHALFGIGANPPPRLVLMDEIHLHEGIYGAQIAYLLRRWRHARGRHVEQSLCVVGLSATLSNAEHFFARLTGIPPAQIRYVTPADEALIEEGMEYNVVLKGDPASGTTLLSTSVRTAGLICRVMDPEHLDVSAGAIGKRVFAFSDKLDLINRWYHIEREVENPREPYSRYLYVPRGVPDASERYALGQHWWFIPQIHQSPDVLTSGLQVDITSSQYAGVNAHANLVIASSTLEVGYNDPSVGAIIQHKTPISRAAFLQRKGRAGRPRAMRPWMVLVTSAYGFDRWAFQHAETLFDPLLPPLDLPLENYYVLKIQATYALIDWLAQTAGSIAAYPSVRDVLAGSRAPRDVLGERLRSHIIAHLQGFLDDPSRRQMLRAHLADALQLDPPADDLVNSLLWGEPRPLLLQVIPTLLRQLESNWQRAVLEDDRWRFDLWDDNLAERPLPDFVPAALFADLKSPEVQIRIPEPRRKPESPPVFRTEETLGLALTMSEYVPGKVNKRFAHKDRIREAHWLELPPADGNTIDLSQLAVDYDPVPIAVTHTDSPTTGEAQAKADDDEGLESAGSAGFQLLRPRRVDLSIVPHHIRPTSSASFVWKSRFLRRTRYPVDDGHTIEGLPLTLRAVSPWQSLFTAIRAYTQGESQWVVVTRAATGVDVFTRFDQGGERRASYSFVANGAPAAFGFQIDADALAFTLTPIDTAFVRNHPAWPALYREYAPQFYAALMAQDARTRALHLSALELEWLWQVTLAVFTAVAVEQSVTLAEATTIVGQVPKVYANQVLSTLFGGAWQLSAEEHLGRAPTPPSAAEVDDDTLVEPGAPSNAWQHAPAASAQAVPELTPRDADSTVETEEVSFLHAKLLNLLVTPEIWAMLAEHASVLWDDSHPALVKWLQELYRHSVAATVYSALLALAPEMQNDDIHQDVVGDTIWISEAAAGGVGLIAKLVDRIAGRPQLFDLQMHHALYHCPRQELAAQLGQVTGLIAAGNPELAAAFAKLRSAGDLLQIEQTRKGLAQFLDGYGIALTRSLTVALNSKFLRPNSDQDSDHLIADLVTFWQTEQDRLGIAIDLRIIAAVAAQRPGFQQAIAQVLGRIGHSAGPVPSEQAYNLLTSLLWLDCHDGCPDCIEHPQRYQHAPRPSRALLKLFVAREEQWVDGAAADWQVRLTAQLATHHEAILCVQAGELAAIHPHLFSILATPVETTGQLHFPTLHRLDRVDRVWQLHFTLPDLAQG